MQRPPAQTTACGQETLRAALAYRTARQAGKMDRPARLRAMADPAISV